MGDYIVGFDVNGEVQEISAKRVKLGNRYLLCKDDVENQTDETVAQIPFETVEYIVQDGVPMDIIEEDEEKDIQQHDHSGSSTGGDVLNPKQITLPAEGDYGRFQGSWVVSPTANDWGGAINEILAHEKFSRGDSILVPSVPYENSTAALIDKQVAIDGLGAGAANVYNDNAPIIDKEKDTEHVIIEENCTISNLNFQDSLSHSSKDNIVSHHKFEMSRCIVEGSPDAQVRLEQAEDDDNLNHTIIDGVGTAGGNYGVVIENTSNNASDINTLRVWVAEATHHSNAAIDIRSGGGTHARVTGVQSTSTGIRFNASTGYLGVGYAEVDVANSIDIVSGSADFYVREDRSKEGVNSRKASEGKTKQGLRKRSMFDLSGVTANHVGDTALDDGSNTTHGDPDLCIWTGSDWRQAGTTNTFT